MIKVDLHTHTKHSHAKASVQEMFESGQKAGLEIHGFSEHSPRPLGFDYPSDYREKLQAGFPNYVAEVQGLAQKHKDTCTVLLGLELDWLPSQVDFAKATVAQYDYDYIIAGIHFLDNWGFDFTPDDWANLSNTALADIYTRYFAAVEAMAESGLFQILAHPDIIKLFSVDKFHAWLANADAKAIVRRSFEAVKAADVAIEISSAGLRKPCKEIYSCPTIMEMAADLEIPISFGSDAHCVNTMAWGFDQLEAYARRFGYTQSVWFRKKERFLKTF